MLSCSVDTVGVCCCRVPTSLRPIFDSDADKDTLYSEERVCALLKAYAEREGLGARQGAIKLDKYAPPSQQDKRCPPCISRH